MVRMKVSINPSGQWLLIIPKAEVFNCQVCKVRLTTPYYFCELKQRFWCPDCRVIDWDVDCVSKDDHIHYNITYVEVKP